MTTILHTRALALKTLMRKHELRNNQLTIFLSVFYIGLSGVLFFPKGAQAEVLFSGDVNVLYDQVKHLPNGNQQLEGGSIWLNASANYFSESMPELDIGISIRSAYSSENRKKEHWFLENERAEGSDLTELFMNYQWAPSHKTWAGRKALPIELSTMVWDHDLTPIGLGYQYRTKSNDDSDISMTLGSFNTKDFHDVDAKLAVAQLEWLGYFGRFPIDFNMTYLGFTDIHSLNDNGVRRQNSSELESKGDANIIQIKLSSLMDISDLQLSYGIQLVENRSLSDANQAGRVEFALMPMESNNWQVNYQYHRIQRNAVIAAFSDDDWWFASWMKGHRVGLNVMMETSTEFSLSYFSEQLDIRNEDLQRIIVRLTYSF